MPADNVWFPADVDAGANYHAIAAQFDDAAKRFTDVASSVDVEADAASIIAKPDKGGRHTSPPHPSQTN